MMRRHRAEAAGRVAVACGPQAALVAARDGLLEDPPVPAPARLLPYLEFSKYPPAALEVTRRVLDEDVVFRARVLDRVDLVQLGEAGDLFLRRPPGWGKRLAKLEAAASSQAQTQREARDERRATKQLQMTKGALEQARAQAHEQAAQVSTLRESLAAELAARRQAEDRLGDLEAAAAKALDERASAVRELKAMEARLADRTRELRALSERLTAREAEIAAEREQARGAVANSTPVAEPSGAEPGVAAAAEAPAAPSNGSPLDRVSLAAAIAEASAAASQLAAALGRASHDLRVPVVEERARRDVRAVRSARRRPVRLPIGVFDDSVEAAEALVNVDSMLVLVDGYNVTLSGWPELPLVLQRERLIDALGALQARTAVGVTIIFDGAEAGRDLPPESRLRGLQVRFTQPDVEADDVIIESVARLPADRPVTVVSSDNRVREGASAGGANLLSSEQLLALFRR
ncbi:MAG: NYN domain-containing protein [Actinobacteria bacterium]|nr:NYN domain-containing protein [Actinomycetota bacterium]